ncbi:MAG: helix-turn-helix domain-containing protein [Burkholderiales bacterium]
MLGEHIRQRRLKLALTQRQAAAQLQVSPWTVLNWERGHTAPPVGALPSIFLWLGYAPLTPAKSLRERMRQKRQVMGWTIREAARQLGVDEATWRSWEGGGKVAWPRFRERLEVFLGGAP